MRTPIPGRTSTSELRGAMTSSTSPVPESGLPRPNLVSPNNLLVALSRYAHQQEENFTTEAFAHLLRHLFRYEAEVGSTIVRDLTRGKIRLEPGACGAVRVTTQVHRGREIVVGPTQLRECFPFEFCHCDFLHLHWLLVEHQSMQVDRLRGECPAGSQRTLYEVPPSQSHLPAITSNVPNLPQVLALTSRISDSTRTSTNLCHGSSAWGRPSRRHCALRRFPKHAS
jgi:hypothetical protein